MSVWKRLRLPALADWRLRGRIGDSPQSVRGEPKTMTRDEVEVVGPVYRLFVVYGSSLESGMDSI